MRIAVFGLGYVGTVSAACLADLGHVVIGVDPNTTKVDRINAAESPVLEPGVPEMIVAARAMGRLRATTDPAEAVRTSDMSLICVGTPSRTNGSIDLAYIEAVAAQIGDALAGSEAAHLVVIRSTVLPGTGDRVAQILETHSGRRLGSTLGVATNPEFLREGTGVLDFLNPPLILVGSDDSVAASTVMGIYDGIDAHRYLEPLRVAEMAKYASNSFHATKVTFANEIGAVSRSLGIDGSRVMELLCADDKLNISPAYLRPGFAFGGSCLPKDVRALNSAARAHDVDTPLLSSLLTSNRVQIERLLHTVIDSGAQRIGFAGFSFKEGTDDLRESPIVEVVERLLGKGFDCVIHDADVSAPDLIGGNRAFIEQEIPHLNRLLVEDLGAMIDNVDVVIVTKSSPHLVELLAGRRAGQLLIDLVRLPVSLRVGSDYIGVAW